MPFRTPSLPSKAMPWAAALATLGAVAFAAPAAQAATFTVNTANNAGAGSLRWAITQAELQPNQDTIRFNIPGAGPQTIALANDLPVLSRQVTIRGFSQPGASAATSTTPAQPMVVIDASNALRGLDIGGDQIEIRGLVVHSAQTDGIFVEGRENVIAGNHIGTNAAGTALLPNGGHGVEIYGGENRIGGPAAADRNVISGQSIEVRVKGGTGHVIEGNRIGTNAAGTAGLGTAYGMMVDTGGNFVRDNLVSGEFVGIELLGDANVVQGNLVGTDAAGTAAISSCLGVNVEGGDENLIGGTGEGEANVFSGNDCGGLQLEQGDATDPEEEIGPAVGNKVKGNFIGTDATGTIPIPNGVGWGIAGMAISGSNDNVIGGSEPSAGNVIATNEGEGILIIGAGAEDNSVLGNWIGTNPAGALGLGNGKSGVRILDASRNRIGDPLAASPVNVIAHNGEDGVAVEESAGAASGNAVVGNQIFGNGSAAGDLAIDLAADGLTLNDALDADTGPNALQNTPVISSAIDVGATKVQWTLDSLASTSYRLDFYAGDSCDASGSGELDTPLGSTTVVTDAAGHGAASTLTSTAATVGQQVSMTATRLTAGGALRETSEPSPCQVVS